MNSNLACGYASSKGGFNFDLYYRNAALEASAGVKPPKATSTGTTIVGLVYKDGIVLGADTRATSGPVVADKNCEKIHFIAPNIYCCGAGTAADTEFTTRVVRSNLHLHFYNSKRAPRVMSALTLLKHKLYSYQGYIGAALILGGIDCTGPHLYTIYPHGSTNKHSYATMGSGSLAAMVVFEAGYRPNLEREPAIELVSQAIQAGIFNDLGSGSNVDVVVISSATGVETLRNYKGYPRVPKNLSYTFARGATEIVSEQIFPFSDDDRAPKAIVPLSNEAMMMDIEI